MVINPQMKPSLTKKKLPHGRGHNGYDFGDQIKAGDRITFPQRVVCWFEIQINSGSRFDHTIPTAVLNTCDFIAMERAALAKLSGMACIPAPAKKVGQR